MGNMSSNPYVPFPSKIKEIIRHTEKEYTFRMSFTGDVKPGQFFEVSVPKYGEAPISVSGIGEDFVDLTIRKVGRVTSVTIRTQAHDHWEGADGIQVGQIPTEVTRLYRPELYEEYMSAQTSAIRKYEIADELYAEGFTLPYIRGLHEQYKREVAEALKEGGDARTIAEHTPANITPKSKDDKQYKELDINRNQEIGDMDAAPEESEQ